MSSSFSNFNASFILTDKEIGLLSFVNVLFSTVGTLGNVFVCFTFVACPGLRDNTNKFILSLACSDLLVCLIAQPMFVVSLVKRYQQKYVSNAFEDARKMLTWVSLLASAGNLLGVTFTRYLAIVNPLSYRGNDRQRFTEARTWLFVIVVWVIAICFGASTRVDPNMKLVGQIYVFVVVICLIFPLYCRVLCIAWKQKRRIMRAIRTVRHVTVNNHVAIPASWSGSTTAPVMRRNTKRNPLKTIGVICGVFIVGWFPLFVLPFIYRNTESMHDREIVFGWFQWVNTTALCSSAINPIVYSWTDRKFRKALKTVYERRIAKRLVLSQLRSENRSSV